MGNDAWWDEVNTEQDKRNSHEVLSSVADTAPYTRSTPRSVMHL